MILAFDAIGTRWEIETEAPLSPSLRAEVLERIERFDATYSRFRPDSLVSRLAAAPRGGRFQFPDDSLALFELYDRLFASTDGAVDPLVGRALELLGYDASYSLKGASEARAGLTPSWLDLKREGTTVLTSDPVVLDVGAVGKGYLVDLVTAILTEAGEARLVVDAGGDLRHIGLSAIRIGLEHPSAPEQLIGTADIRNSALCASATNRRAWGHDLHHILDARTGVPVAGVVASWVVAERAALADGLATALFFTSARRLAQTFHFTSVVMRADGQAEQSPDFDGELFRRIPDPLGRIRRRAPYGSGR